MNLSLLSFAVQNVIRTVLRKEICCENVNSLLVMLTGCDGPTSTPNQGHKGYVRRVSVGRINDKL